MKRFLKVFAVLLIGFALGAMTFHAQTAKASQLGGVWITEVSPLSSYAVPLGGNEIVGFSCVVRTLKVSKSDVEIERVECYLASQ